MMDKHGEHIASAAAITAATVVAVTRRRDMVVGIAALVAYLAGTFALKNSYYQLIFTLVPIWACLGVDAALYPRYQLQAWLPMRWRLTWVASVSCLAGAVALLPSAQRG